MSRRPSWHAMNSGVAPLALAWLTAAGSSSSGTSKIPLWRSVADAVCIERILARERIQPAKTTVCVCHSLTHTHTQTTLTVVNK